MKLDIASLSSDKLQEAAYRIEQDYPAMMPGFWDTLRRAQREGILGGGFENALGYALLDTLQMGENPRGLPFEMEHKGVKNGLIKNLKACGIREEEHYHAIDSAVGLCYVIGAYLEREDVRQVIAQRREAAVAFRKAFFEKLANESALKAGFAPLAAEAAKGGLAAAAVYEVAKTTTALLNGQAPALPEGAHARLVDGMEKSLAGHRRRRRDFSVLKRNVPEIRTEKARRAPDKDLSLKEKQSLVEGMYRNLERMGVSQKRPGLMNKIDAFMGKLGQRIKMEIQFAKSDLKAAGKAVKNVLRPGTRPSVWGTPTFGR